MKITKIISADFETTTVVKKDNETYSEYRDRIKEFNPTVYSWAICFIFSNKDWDKYKDLKNSYIKKRGDKKYIVIDGTDIFAFIDFLKEIDEDIIMYFHNGSKFDLHFLLPYMEFLKYKQLIVDNSDKLSDTNEFNFEDLKNSENVVLSEKPRKVQPGEYSLLVDGSYKIMEMKIGVESTKQKVVKTKLIKLDGSVEFKKTYQNTNRAIIIRDSNLMFPSSLKGYGETLNKEYKTDIFSKQELDSGYTKTTEYNNYQEFINDGNEQEYLHQDVIILIEFLHMMNNVLPFRKWGITAAGTTYKVWKYDFFAKVLIDKALKDNKIEKIVKDNGFIHYKYKGGKKPLLHKFLVNNLFSKFFPTTWLNGFFIDGLQSNFNFFHQSYQGGLSMSNPDLAGKLIKYILYLDINSSYPDKMLNMRFPYGTPYIGDSGNKDDLKIYRVYVYDVKNEKGLPFLYNYLKVNEGKHYPKKIKHREYILTDVEYNNFIKYYKGKYDSEIVCSFKSVSGKYIFGDFIEYFYNIKSNAKSQAEKIYAKLMLNSLYGKFGQDIARESKIYFDNQWDTMETIDNAKFYLPLASWITAYARNHLVEATGKKFENIVALDTDSLMVKVPKEIWKDDNKIKSYIESNYKMNIDSSKLGAWDIEHKIKEMITRRAKQYMFIDNQNKKHIKFAGLRLNNEHLDKIDFESFVFGFDKIEQLRPYRTPSGLILENYEKELKAIWDYNLNPDYWFNDEKTFKKNKKIV